MDKDPDPTELELFNKFLPRTEPSTGPLAAGEDDADGGTNLADLILEKIAAHEAMHEGPAAVTGPDVTTENVELHPKVVQVYST